MEAEKADIEKVLENPLSEEIKTAIHAYQKIQKIVLSLSEKNEETETTSLKIGTVLSFAVIGKITGGKNPQGFTKDDWKDIADTITEYAVIADGQSYTVFVFETYADYLDSSAQLLEHRVSLKVIESIHGLSRDIRDLSKSLENGDISEADYVENCLWISFEGIIKLISAAVGSTGGKEFGELTAAVATLSVQYGRLVLYQKEQAIIDEFIREQNQLDSDLKQQYAMYMQEVQLESEHFQTLIADAFAPDFGERLRNSVQLAREAGVREEDILVSEEDIDDFFLE